MAYYLAVDIGGSKSKFAVLDADGQILDTRETVGFGLAHDCESDLPQLREILTELSQCYPICAAAINLGGKNKEQVTAAARAALSGIPFSVHRESEGGAAIALGRMHKANVVLLAGTGTITVGFTPDGRQIVCGGWGMNVSDGGSGYDIGLHAARQALAALDKTVPLTPLQQEITGHTAPFAPTAEIGDLCLLRDEVRARILPFNRAAVASLTKIVTVHALRGEADALAIMQNAGRDMGLLVADCAGKLHPYTPQKAVVCGGLLHSREFWQTAFEETVRQNCTVTEFAYVSDGLLFGTAALAIHQE